MDALYIFSPLVDIVVAMEDAFPVYAGETKSVKRIHISAGGGANTLFAGSRIGLSISPMGLIGCDAAGEMILSDYASEGVSTEYLTVVRDAATASVVILVDAAGRHAFASVLTCILGNMDRLDEAIAASRAVIACGYQMVDEACRDTMERCITKARALGKTVLFDPGPMIPRIPEDYLDRVLQGTDILFVNEEEAVSLTHAETGLEAAMLLTGRIAGHVVLKLGAEGCLVADRSGAARRYPGFPVRLVDTTGAGDSFLAAYLHGFLAGWDEETRALFANAMGAAKAAKEGCGKNVPTLPEVLSVLNAAGYTPEAETIKTRGRLVLRAQKGMR